MIEHWKPINNSNGYYFISDHGRVKNKKGDLLSTVLARCPYPCVGLYFNKKLVRVKVHRLVYEAFHGPIPKGMQINHKDGIKDNPRLDNLEVVTPLENIHHAIRTGLMGNQGVNNGQAELNEHKVRRIRLMRDTGATFKLIGSIFGVATTHASNIYHRHRWNNLA